jgi:hypothetical protein
MSDRSARPRGHHLLGRLGRLGRRRRLGERWFESGQENGGEEHERRGTDARFGVVSLVEEEEKKIDEWRTSRGFSRLFKPGLRELRHGSMYSALSSCYGTLCGITPNRIVNCSLTNPGPLIGQPRFSTRDHICFSPGFPKNATRNRRDTQPSRLAMSATRDVRDPRWSRLAMSATRDIREERRIGGLASRT